MKRRTVSISTSTSRTTVNLLAKVAVFQNIVRIKKKKYVNHKTKLVATLSRHAASRVAKQSCVTTISQTKLRLWFSSSRPGLSYLRLFTSLHKHDMKIVAICTTNFFSAVYQN